MTEWLLGLVPTYGIWLVGAATFLSCLALPIPSSVVMLAAGGFVGSGDLSLIPVVLAALLGAVAGDQTGYFAARRGENLVRYLSLNPTRGELITRAQAYARDKGIVAVFFSRWLVSPLGPWVNIAAGVAAMPWVLFTIAGVLGEAVWVGLYIGMGSAFGGSIEAASDAIGSLLGMIGAGAAAVVLGWWLLRAARRQSA